MRRASHINTIPYSEMPKDGKYTDIEHLRGVALKVTGSLVHAREYAYEKLSHKGINKNGNLYCVISTWDRDFEKIILAGEVMNTVDDTRFWYPSSDGVYAYGHKYTLNRDGTLGTKWR